MRSPNVHIDLYGYTFEDIASGFTSGMYDHMSLILTKNNDRTFGQKYLYISRNVFGLVKLHDLDLVDRKVTLDLEVISTGLRKKVYLDVDDPTFKFLLISWHDIKQIMSAEIVHTPDSTDLLEFEF